MKDSSNGCTILLVDDEEQILFSSSLLLKGSGLGPVITKNDGARVMETLEKEEVSLIVLDLCMPGVAGQDLLKEINYRFPQTLVIVMTAVSEVATAVSCMKSGAFDYLIKPVQKDEYLACIRRALAVCSLQRENRSLKQGMLAETLAHEELFSEITTGNRQMRSIFRYMEAVASLAEPLLVTGESGVGKELIARAIHKLSGRKGNLVAANVAGLDDSVFSDTIFGHKRGSYTGAENDREGLIACAAGGTLVLDEIGDLDAKSQVKLLRLLQEREFYPLGSDIPKKSEARIVAMTNRDLGRMVGEGGFRNDLYYRLCSHHVQIPPLRERLDDLPLLLDRFLAEAALAQGKKIPSYPRELITLLSCHGFPGNVRELRGMVQDAVSQHKGGVLSLESFKRRIDAKDPLRGDETEPEVNFSPFADRLPTFDEADAYLVAEALRRADGNQGIAAKMLGVTRQALNRRLHRTPPKKG